MNFELTEENFLFYAIKHYDNPACKGMNEFEDDLKRFRYLKRLFRKNNSNSGLKERLIINHLVILNNLFGPEAATKMLFFKIDKKYWSQLKTFLVFLNYMPDSSISVRGKNIPESDIPLDENIIATLRQL